MSVRSGPFRIEVVCTANICRSPYVHVRLADTLDRLAPGEFEVLSSGTLALAGTPPDPGTRRVARERGHTLSGMRAQQTTPVRLAEADLILVMDKEQRQTVIDEYPGAARRTFLFKELARLVTVLGAEQSWPHRLAGVGAGETGADQVRARWRKVVAAAMAQRERLGSDGDELDDPFRQGPEAFARMAAEADAAVATLVALESEARTAVSARHRS